MKITTQIRENLKEDKLMKVDRMGALVLMAHLIITLAMIAAYTFFTYMGKSTTSIENMLLIAIGFWFASMGQHTQKPTNTTNVQHANEVKNVSETKTDLQKGE